jgi:hypothetical protein
MGTKFLAPMLFAAATKGLGMAEVLHWLDSREDQEVKDILAVAGVPAATDAWESSQYRTDRAVDSLYATAEEVLAVYGNQRVSASTDGHDLDLDAFLSGDNTIYPIRPGPSAAAVAALVRDDHPAGGRGRPGASRPR